MSKNQITFCIIAATILAIVGIAIIANLAKSPVREDGGGGTEAPFEIGDANTFFYDPNNDFSLKFIEREEEAKYTFDANSDPLIIGKFLVRWMETSEYPTIIFYVPFTDKPEYDAIINGMPDPTFDDLLDAIVTAYCPCEKCCGKWSDGFTASGHKIELGDKFVAASPEIPFGTIFTIPGYGKVPVLDRGGSTKGNRFDVFFPTHQEALNWGRQYLKVERLEIK